MNTLRNIIINSLIGIFLVIAIVVVFEIIVLGKERRPEFRGYVIELKDSVGTYLHAQCFDIPLNIDEIIHAKEGDTATYAYYNGIDSTYERYSIYTYKKDSWHLYKIVK